MLFGFGVEGFRIDFQGSRVAALSSYSCDGWVLGG